MRIRHKVNKPTARIAVISCTHAPHTPRKTQEWVLKQLEEIKPTHFGHLGDVFDSAAASVHSDSSEVSHDLEEEYAHAAKFLAEIRKVVGPDCVRWINRGNHDSNIEAADPRRIPKGLRSLVHWMNHPVHGEEFRQWEWLPYVKSARSCKQIGPCIFYHGFDVSLSSDELEGLEMRNLCGGYSHRLTVRGHTHRPLDPVQSMRTKKVPLPHWYMNVGTCGPLKPQYMERKSTAMWGAAIGVIDCSLKRPGRITTKEFEARLVRMD